MSTIENHSYSIIKLIISSKIDIVELGNFKNMKSSQDRNEIISKHDSY